MTDPDLQKWGVAVVGAQQEILRNFETIWIKTQMVFPSDSDSFQEANGDWVGLVSRNVNRVFRTVTVESFEQLLLHSCSPTGCTG